MAPVPLIMPERMTVLPTPPPTPKVGVNPPVAMFPLNVVVNDVPVALKFKADEAVGVIALAMVMPVAVAISAPPEPVKVMPPVPNALLLLKLTRLAVLRSVPPE